MCAKKPSQTDLYGEVLTNEQQYRVELAALTDNERRDFPSEDDPTLQRARSGDASAREQIILQILPRLERFCRFFIATYHWASHRIEYADLVQEGSRAILERFDHALTVTSNPYPYLYVVGKMEIIQYVNRFCSAILTPQNSANPNPPHECVSLEEPITPTMTRLDLLANTLEAKSQVVDDEDPHAKHRPLYEAIETLSPQEQIALLHYHGLEGGSGETCRSLGIGKGVPGYARQKAYIYLVCRYPSYRQAYSDGKTDSVARLQQAVDRIKARGDEITLESVAREAKLERRVVVAYLQHIREPQRCPQERLQQAHAALEQRGEKITRDTLAKEARIDGKLVRSYLKAIRPPVVPPSERLSQAYATLKAQGGRVTIHGLMKEAHVNQGAATAYLRGTTA